jgi:hypothetical protein
MPAFATPEWYIQAHGRCGNIRSYQIIIIIIIEVRQRGSCLDRFAERTKLILSFSPLVVSTKSSGLTSVCKYAENSLANSQNINTALIIETTKKCSCQSPR